MATPFLIYHRPVAEGPVHLLPSPNAVLVLSRETGSPNRLVMPHRGVVVVDGARECALLAPNIVKCLLGQPRRFLGLTIGTGEHPMLQPFTAVTRVAENSGSAPATASETDEAAASTVLVDLRDSLAITTDEADFIDLWRHDGVGLATGDRRVQRLCLRYAGQSPKAVAMTIALARTLDADNASGLVNSLGLYADASHMGRVCLAFTGRTPRGWRNMSQTFY